MAADVQVSEIDVLKAYSGKMNGLRNDSIVLAVLLDRQIRKIKEDYDKLLMDMRRAQRNVEDNTRLIVERYERAMNICGEEARPVIGTSDLVAQQKNEIMQVRYESILHNIQNLQMKLKNAGLKTQNYAAQMDTLADACISYVNRYAEKLQEYKDLKK